MARCRSGLVLVTVLLVGCAGEPEPAPAPRRSPEARQPEPTVKISGTAPPPPARDPTEPADPERVAELERRLKADAERAPSRERPAGAAPRLESDEPEEPALVNLDLDGLVEALGDALRRSDAIEPLPREADLASLGAEDRRLDRLERRLRGVAYRLQVRLDERIRAWERDAAAEDAPLAAEEQRLLGRSAAVVLGPDRAYVDSPEEELELVRAQRAELAQAHRERVAALRAAYEPLLTRAAAARADVGTARRAVQRRLAAPEQVPSGG